MAEDHSDIASASTRNTCLRLELPVEDPKSKDAVFVKAAWFPSCFELAISDGLNAWACHATEAEVRLRAEQWDLSVTEYISLSEQYLGFQQPGSKSTYQGTKLEWRWKCKPSSDNKKMTSGILDFLMDANIRLSEEVVRRARSFEILKSEADKCLEQSERFSNEKSEFESAVYNKFVAVLNSKKAKLRELRDKLSSLEATAKAPKEEDDSTDKTESLDEASDRETLIKEEPDEE
ncbi:hypothetical protein ZIOFF_052552 [Zingiber officinale]|uniref:DNA repair protein XRCC4 n=1 Tax=Zingiber officinale TaxID=94328 RepID=A0A8J5FVG2_ZINOF|nr:hypothetical protein ZIOFF_052552 [Zingiber officinale]